MQHNMAGGIILKVDIENWKMQNINQFKTDSIVQFFDIIQLLDDIIITGEYSDIYGKILTKIVVEFPSTTVYDEYIVYCKMNDISVPPFVECTDEDIDEHYIKLYQ